MSDEFGIFFDEDEMLATADEMLGDRTGARPDLEHGFVRLDVGSLSDRESDFVILEEILPHGFARSHVHVFELLAELVTIFLLGGSGACGSVRTRWAR
jgi:hypothetical protein